MKLVDSSYIEKFKIPWCYREDSYKISKLGKGFIINLDDKGNPGSHWTAARVFNGTLYYADPFGTMLNGWPPSELDEPITKKVINRVSFQRPKSNFCGYYSICFALAMDCIDRELSRSLFEEVLYRSII